MIYTIETRRTLDGPRYYIRRQGKLLQGGFATHSAAAERIKRIKYFEVLDQARAQLKAQIQGLRQERRA